jgi:hypothetical protein
MYHSGTAGMEINLLKRFHSTIGGIASGRLNHDHVFTSMLHQL